MTPTALANNISNPVNVPWQPIPASAALNSIRNGNVIIKNKLQDDIRSKSFYGVRPTDHLALAPSTNKFLYNSLNYPNCFNEAGGDRMLHTLRRPIAPVPFRDELN